LAEGMPGPGGCGEGGLRRQISPQPAKYTKKAPRTGGSPFIFWLKISEIALFFAQKYLMRYTSKMFFEEYINLKFFFT
jgi:hypothetical protein